MSSIGLADIRLAADIGNEVGTYPGSNFRLSILGTSVGYSAPFTMKGGADDGFGGAYFYTRAWGTEQTVSTSSVLKDYYNTIYETSDQEQGHIIDVSVLVTVTTDQSGDRLHLFKRDNDSTWDASFWASNGNVGTEVTAVSWTGIDYSETPYLRARLEHGSTSLSTATMNLYSTNATTGKAFPTFSGDRDWVVATGYSPPAGGITAATVNASIGRGVNGYNLIMGGTPQWKDSYYADVKSQGFDSVRIVYYRGSTESVLTTDHMNRLQVAVDKCIENGLLAIIDYHSIPQFWAGYTAGQGTTMVNNWGTIADHFKGYGHDVLVYELANEPVDVTPATWNALAASMVSKIREYDGRFILISPLFSAHVEGVLDLTLPTDSSLILSIHHYKPDWVVQQGCTYTSGLNGTRYIGADWTNVDAMEENFRQYFSLVEDFRAANNDISVNIGEWGTMIFVDSSNRQLYSTLAARWYESQGYSWNLWDYDQDFGVMKNPSLGYEATREPYPQMLNALMTDEVDFQDYTVSILVDNSSGWSSVGSWSKYEQGGTSISLSVVDGSLVADLTNTQYTYLWGRVWSPTFDMAQSDIIRVSYTLSCNVTRDLAHKFSGDHPWYYTYDLASTPVDVVHTYIDPSAVTQYGARIELIIGNVNGIVTLKNFMVEKLTPV